MGVRSLSDGGAESPTRKRRAIVSGPRLGLAHREPQVADQASSYARFDVSDTDSDRVLPRQVRAIPSLRAMRPVTGSRFGLPRSDQR